MPIYCSYPGCNGLGEGYLPNSQSHPYCDYHLDPCHHPVVPKGQSGVTFQIRPTESSRQLARTFTDLNITKEKWDLMTSQEKKDFLDEYIEADITIVEELLCWEVFNIREELQQ